MKNLNKIRAATFDKLLNGFRNAFFEVTSEVRSEVLSDLTDEQKLYARKELNAMFSELANDVKQYDWYKNDNKALASTDKNPIKMLDLAIETHKRGHSSEASLLFAIAANNIGEFLPTLVSDIKPKPSKKLAIASTSIPQNILESVKTLASSGEGFLAEKLLAEATSENRVYVSLDGDNVGASVKKAAMSDDLNLIIETETNIKQGQDLLRAFAARNLGVVYLDGGDDLGMTLPESKIDLLEGLRQDYATQTGYTVTIGIGTKLSESVIALEYGKLSGKDQIVQYSENIKNKYEKLKE